MKGGKIEGRLPEGIQRLLDLEGMGSAAPVSSRFNCTPRATPIGPVVAVTKPRKPVPPAHMMRESPRRKTARELADEDMPAEVLRSRPGTAQSMTRSESVMRSAVIAGAQSKFLGTTNTNAVTTSKGVVVFQKMIGDKETDRVEFPTFLPLVSFDVFEDDGKTTPPLNRIDYINGQMDIRSDREGGTKVAMAVSK